MILEEDSLVDDLVVVGLEDFVGYGFEILNGKCSCVESLDREHSGFEVYLANFLVYERPEN